MAGASVVAMGVVSVLIIIFYLLVLAFSVAMYVLNGLGLMKMAKTCGLRHPWMGFVPFASTYLIGQLAEQNPTQGKKSWPWRHIALIGEIVITALAVALCIFMIGDMFNVMAAGGEYSEYDMLSLYGSMFGLMAPLSLLSTVYSIVLYIIYWKIYSLFAPNLAVVFLVLTILFNITPILIFILRNRQPVNRPGPTNDQWV
ncbi:MAG: hypothetical protein IJX53_00320 [Clostridia bacterium]|nr:hypothetical protein [Clostridia bacterium]